METTTHSTSKGDVLPATDKTGEPQTFEQRTIRTLVGLERRRLKMAETELAMEGERLAMQRESLAAMNAHRVASSKAVLDLVQVAVPLVLSFVERTTEGGLDEDALHAAIADVASEFPDLKKRSKGARELAARPRAVRLSAERLEVSEGERLHAVLVVHPSVVSVLAAGGLAHLTHALEDVGFRDVRAWPLPPPGWTGGTEVATPGELEWLLWVAATPVRSASLDRALTEDVRIADAWPALEEREDLARLSPYATAYAAPTRLAGVLHVFGTAYPLGALEC